MRNSRLPSLDLLRGFEAAARHMSFTRAARELNVTQSAVSRQIKAVEDQLGVPLFRRLNRALVLTEEGQGLARAVATALGGIEAAVMRLSARADDRPVTVTTTVSFAALWLVPRLARLRSVEPQVNVRLVATNEMSDLAREEIDVAVRYCEPRAAPPGSEPLTGEDVFPVASPRLARARGRPLKAPADLGRHVLLHLADPQGEWPWLTWREWLTAFGIPDLKPAGEVHFSHYDQLVRAATEAEGVALGRAPMIERFLESGELVAPFRDRVTVSRKYFVIVAPQARERPRVKRLVEWLISEAAGSSSKAE